MHSRNRSLGIAPRSSMSPEGSVRDRGFCNSVYRNYNRGRFGRKQRFSKSEYSYYNRRGFGCGQRQNFKSRHSPARKGEIFVEAGRLAVEILVTKGILPPNVLSDKWQNSGWKNQVADFSRDKSPNGESVPSYADSQGPGRKRCVYDNKQRSRSFKSYGNESNKKWGSRGSLSYRPRDTLNLKCKDHTSAASKKYKKVRKYSDSGVQRSPRNEATPKSDSVEVVEYSIGKSKPINDKHKAEDFILPHTEGTEENSLRADVKPNNKSSDVKISDGEGGGIRDESNNGDDQHGDMEGKSLESCVDEDNKEINLDSELLRLSLFGNVPTKTHSSLTMSTNIEQEHITEVKELNMIELPDKYLALAVNVPVHSSSTGDSSNSSLNSKNLGSGLNEESAADEEHCLASFNGQEICKSLMMFSDKSFKQEVEGNESLALLSIRGEKRTLEDYDSRDGTKKPRDLVPSAEASPDNCSDISTSMGKRHSSEEPIISISGDEKSDQKRLMDMHLFPKGDIPCIEFTEIKQLFAGSCKTLYLNLLEVSELSEIQDNANSTSVLPPVLDSGKQEMQVDTDLYMSNKTMASEKFAKCGKNAKAIKMNDLENDSVQDDEVFGFSEKRSDSIFTSLDIFQSNSHNDEGLDVPGSYGLMLLNLHGNEMQHCSAVPLDKNSLHNDMDLLSGEVIFENDDSMCRQFGEIPISFC